MTSLSRLATAWMDGHYDAERRLLWNPPNSFDGVAAPHSFHIVPQNAWYVLGLLERKADGDVERATAIVDALGELQYHEPGTPWDATFARFAETPQPTEGAVMWEDYDPNWRQFIATALTLAVRIHPGVLPPVTERRIEAMSVAAVQGEPPERVPAYYSNIALKKAWLDVEYGHAERGEAFAEEVVELFDRTGAFVEFNSPTYYGVDLWGLALWRAHSSSARLREWGARLEAALWRSAADFYHAGLRNLAGPYTRAYGLDMTRYLAQFGLWVWEGVDPTVAPLPDLDGDFAHSHDLCFGPCPAAASVAVPEDVASTFRTFPGEHIVDVAITEDPARRATAWLADDVMIGAESGEIDFGGWDQMVPGTIHWRRPDGSVGVIALRQPGKPSGRAEPGRLTVTGPCDLLYEGRPLEPGHHALPGLDATVAADGDRTVVEVSPSSRTQGSA